ncbi:MAG TPA: FAD-binding oxidoreductase [Candidatus Nanoarchaeia archaeon]|nr:FAD-binding oxidoreductase [Candidatus Nanoarchaeia archaeon]
MAIVQFNSKILEIIGEAPEVKTFVLACPKDFNFLPGQFIMLSFPEEKLAKAYSIASSPTKRGMIDLTIKIESYTEEELQKHLTPRLNHVRENQELIVKGPYGKFVLDETKQEYVFLAAGTGIAPLMSMIRYMLDKKMNKKITLINSNKTQKHIIYKKELESMKNKINIVQTITRDDEKHNHHPGRIDKELLSRHVNNKQAMFYICGPNEMVRAAKQHLLDLNIPQEHVHIELW